MEQPELVGSLHFSEPLLLATPVLIKLPHLQPPCLPTYVQSAVKSQEQLYGVESSGHEGYPGNHHSSVIQHLCVAQGDRERCLLTAISQWLQSHIPQTFTECLLCVSLCRGGQGRRSRGDRSTLRCHGPGRGHQEMQRSMLSAQPKVTEGTQATVGGEGWRRIRGF